MQRTPFEKVPNGTAEYFLGVLKIALGVFVGALAAALTYEQILAYRTNLALHQATQEINAQAQRRHAEITHEKQRLAENQAREREQTQRLLAARTLAERLERERTQRKDEAWTRFFRPTPECQADSGTAACANAYMAARKQFEKQYRDL